MPVKNFPFVNFMFFKIFKIHKWYLKYFVNKTPLGTYPKQKYLKMPFEINSLQRRNPRLYDGSIIYYKQIVNSLENKACSVEYVDKNTGWKIDTEFYWYRFEDLVAS